MDAPEATMTQTGVGPWWVLVSLLSCIPFMAPRLLWSEGVRIPFIPRAVVVGIGVVLLGLGIPLCRHPLYGSWNVFIVPCLVLFADDRVELLAPIPMYVALRLMVPKEEAWLESTFGDACRDYRARVRRVLPIPHFRRYRPPPRLAT